MFRTPCVDAQPLPTVHVQYPLLGSGSECQKEVTTLIDNA